MRSKSSRVPRPVMAATMYGEIVTAEDIGPLLKDVGLDLAPEVRPEVLARRLNSVATDFVLTNCALSASTPGETIAFLETWSRRLTEASEPFFEAGQAEFEIEVVGRILRGDQAGAALRPEMASTVRDWLLATLALRARIREIAPGYEKQKNAPRAAPSHELGFFRECAKVYLESFGRELGVSTTLNQVRGGPGVRFCLGIVALIKSKLLTGELDGDAGLSAILERLSKPDAVAERIRQNRGK